MVPVFMFSPCACIKGSKVIAYRISMCAETE